jgi:hypothetical protein
MTRKAPARAVLSVAWGNPCSSPPSDVETLPDGRTLWACTVLDRAVEEDIRAANAPGVAPGSGWCHRWSEVPRPVKPWSGERKAATRRRNLRARLDKAVPLFADQLEAEEIARRPGYFDPAAIEAADARRT